MSPWSPHSLSEVFGEAPLGLPPEGTAAAGCSFASGYQPEELRGHSPSVVVLLKPIPHHRKRTPVTADCEIAAGLPAKNDSIVQELQHGGGCQHHNGRDPVIEPDQSQAGLEQQEFTQAKN
jgi:hypothetical protein